MGVCTHPNLKVRFLALCVYRCGCVGVWGVCVWVWLCIQSNLKVKFLALSVQKTSKLINRKIKFINYWSDCKSHLSTSKVAAIYSKNILYQRNQLYLCALLKWKPTSNNKLELTCKYAFRSFFLFSKKSLSILLKVFLPGSFNMLDRFSNYKTNTFNNLRFFLQKEKSIFQLTISLYIRSILNRFCNIFYLIKPNSENIKYRANIFKPQF